CRGRSSFWRTSSGPCPVIGAAPGRSLACAADARTTTPRSRDRESLLRFAIAAHHHIGRRRAKILRRLRRRDLQIQLAGTRATDARLKREEDPLAADPPAVAGHRTIGADHAVT